MTGSNTATVEFRVIRITLNPDPLLGENGRQPRSDWIENLRCLCVNLRGSWLEYLISRNHDPDHITVFFNGDSTQIQAMLQTFLLFFDN